MDREKRNEASQIHLVLHRGRCVEEGMEEERDVAGTLTQARRWNQCKSVKGTLGVLRRFDKPGWKINYIYELSLLSLLSFFLSFSSLEMWHIQTVRGGKCSALPAYKSFNVTTAEGNDKTLYSSDTTEDSMVFRRRKTAKTYLFFPARSF